MVPARRNYRGRPPGPPRPAPPRPAPRAPRVTSGSARFRAQLAAVSFAEGTPYDSSGLVQPLRGRAALSVPPAGLNALAQALLLDFRLLLRRGTPPPPPPVLNGHASSLPPVLNGHASSLPPVLNGHASSLPPVLNGHSSSLSPVLNKHAASPPFPLPLPAPPAP